jgi:hypothetical protein
MEEIGKQWWDYKLSNGQVKPLMFLIQKAPGSKFGTYESGFSLITSFPPGKFLNNTWK